MGSACLCHHSWVSVLLRAPREKGRGSLGAIIANCQIKSPEREAVTRLSIQNQRQLASCCVPLPATGVGTMRGDLHFCSTLASR